MHDLVSEEELNQEVDLGKLSNSFKSKVGRRFGFLTVLKLAGRNNMKTKNKVGNIDYYLRCDCGNIVRRSASSLAPCNRLNYEKTSCGCKMNSEKTLTLEQMISNIKDKTTHEIIEAKLLYASKWKLRCPEHGEYSRNYSTIVTGVGGCPGCSKFGYSPNKPGHLYLNALYSSNELIAYKFGITNNDTKYRQSQIKSKSNYNIVQVLDLYSEDGEEIYELERYIKKVVPRNYLTKQQLPTGFTETIAPSEIIQFTEIIKYFTER